MSSVEKKIGGKLTEIRLSQKLTQAQLAEKVNLSPESISRLERGVALPSLKTMELIANALNVKLKDFFDFDEERPKEKAFERELSKLTAFLRTLNIKEVKLAHQILKDIFKSINKHFC